MSNNAAAAAAATATLCPPRLLTQRLAAHPRLCERFVVVLHSPHSATHPSTCAVTPTLRHRQHSPSSLVLAPLYVVRCVFCGCVLHTVEHAGGCLRGNAIGCSVPGALLSAQAEAQRTSLDTRLFAALRGFDACCHAIARDGVCKYPPCSSTTLSTELDTSCNCAK